MKKPRLPTEAEKEEPLDYILRENKGESEENRSNVYSLFFGGDYLVAVFDNYQTYIGEYTGKVLVMIGDIDPNQSETIKQSIYSSQLTELNTTRVSNLLVTR